MAVTPPVPNDKERIDSSSSFSLGVLWAELKRRKVVRVAIVYSIVAWLVIQVAVATFPSLLIPDWALRLVIMCVLLGFPIALILAWAFELTPEGIKKSTKISVEPVSEGHQKKRNFLIIIYAAMIPTIIFGALSVFFYLRTGPIEQPLVNTKQETPVQELSIAVLPLINMSADVENGFFADGVHEDILTNLTRIENLKVTSRTTMLRYALSDDTLSEIGKALGVNYVVEGSVRRIGKHVRVTIQLIDALNDHHLWASNFDRELIDVFATQTELSKEITNSLQVEILPQSVGELDSVMTTSVKAYDLYIKSLSVEKEQGETEESLVLRREMLEKAVKLDPFFVEAWARLKLTYARMAVRANNRPWFMETGKTALEIEQNFRRLSANALNKVVAFAPEHPDTLLASIVDHIWPQPESVMLERKLIFDRILKENPTNALAWYNLGWWTLKKASSKEEELLAMPLFEKALKLDPFNARMVTAVLTIYNQYFHDEENMQRLSNRLLQIVPDSQDALVMGRVTPRSKTRYLLNAFIDSADESLLPILREATEISKWEDNLLSIRDVRLADLATFAYDAERIHALAKLQQIDENSESWDVGIYRWLKTESMGLHFHNGNTKEASLIAEKLIAMEVHPWFTLQASWDTFMLASKAKAHWVLGNKGQARKLLEQHLTNDNDDHINMYWEAMSWVDLELAVSSFVNFYNKNPKSVQVDILAAYSLSINPQLLLHPKVKELFNRHGKWKNYLAKFHAEYRP
ncbi:tetratricopeptide repeat protein [Paraglaciecola sp.]|uniref:tetratricopeptide repeat protein n=1 Tax=Paraglaciecola sp. TaxID=1920173 RepID=UPI003EF41617